VERPLGVGLEESRVDAGGGRRLGEDVLRALEGLGQRREVLRHLAPDPLQGGRAPLRIHGVGERPRKGRPEDGGHLVRGEPASRQHVGQAVEEEGPCGIGRRVGGLLQGPVALDRGPHELVQVGGLLARLRAPEVEHGAHRALPGPPQAVGVAAAGRALAEAEVAGQRVELVGEGYRREDPRLPVGAGEGGRGLGLGLDGDRVVVPAHGRGDLVRRALPRQVDPAHDALQLGELTNHEGDEVGLGEPRRPRRLGERVAREDTLPSHRLDQLRHAGGLVAVGAEALLEGHPGQILDAVRERALAVLGQEERGVAQPRHHHPPHAPHDLGPGRSVSVDHRREARDRASRVAHGDGLLVVHEDRLEHLGRERPELRGDLADQDRGVLDEVAPLLAQAVVIPRAAARGGTELVLDPGCTLLGREDHEPLAQAPVQLVPGTNDEPFLGRPLREEPVSARQPPALHDDAAPPSSLERVDGEGHDHPVE